MGESACYTGDLRLPDAAVTAALIAAGASLIASVGALFSSRQARNAVDRQRSEDYRIRQLLDLYGPLYMQRQTTLRLVKQLRDGPNWHILDHIEEIHNEPDDRRRKVVEEILRINEQSSDLIFAKAGLLESFPYPESFEAFLTHARTLQMVWEQGVNAIKANYVTHPSTFDDDILKAIRSLQADLRAVRPAPAVESKWKFWKRTDGAGP
jgi:hypothetical protein